MVVVDDVASSAWIPQVLRSFGSGVGSLVPPVFDDYARVLHPAYACTQDGDERTIRWSVIAEAKQRLVHPLVQFPHLVGTLRFENGPAAPDCWDAPPAEGTMPHELAVLLGSILAEHTATPDRCWFAVWEGFADSLVRDLTHARVHVPSRDLVLLAGPVSAIGTSLGGTNFQSANLWWPEDHAWCVATDIDHVSTYVGGTKAAIADVLAHPDLEAFRVGVDDLIRYDADRLNPPPPGLHPGTGPEG
jgi:hypothetical protein